MCKFHTAVACHLLALIAAVQLVFMLVGGFVWLCDPGQVLSTTWFGLGTMPAWLAYYLIGILFSLAILGLFGGIAHRCSRGDGAENVYIGGGRPYYGHRSRIYDRYGVGRGGAHCCYCPLPGGGSICECGDTTCVCVDDRTCRNCDVCPNGKDDGKATLICFLIIMVIFAIVGIFIGMALGAQYINEMVSEQRSKFWRTGMVKKYRVKHHDQRPANKELEAQYAPSAPPQVEQMEIPNTFPKFISSSEELV